MDKYPGLNYLKSANIKQINPNTFIAKSFNIKTKIKNEDIKEREDAADMDNRETRNV